MNEAIFWLDCGIIELFWWVTDTPSRHSNFWTFSVDKFRSTYLVFALFKHQPIYITPCPFLFENSWNHHISQEIVIVLPHFQNHNCIVLIWPNHSTVSTILALNHTKFLVRINKFYVISDCLKHLNMSLLCFLLLLYAKFDHNEQGELTASYRWPGWVWGRTAWRWRLSGK